MNPNPLFPPGPADTPGLGSHTDDHTLPDQALEELRVRYARGALGRSDSLERSANLGGPPNPDATLPWQPPALDQG